ncbi:MAG: tetratricopeptide repeat protein [Planctomycetota bacterium]|jgi:tetratricopeptide (TPR) repeat protein
MNFSDATDFDDLPEDCRSAIERALVLPPANEVEREQALQEAARCLRLALDEDRARAGLWLFLGEVELLLGDAAHAEAAYRGAVEADPQEVLGYSGLAHSCAAQGRAAEAEDWIEQGLRIEPTAMLYGQLGQLFLEDGRMEEAEGALRTGLALDPDDPELLFLLARFFSRDEAEAERLLVRAIEIEPDHFLAWSELGALRLDLAQLDDARQCFLKLVELAPELSDGYRELAEVELHRDPERALELVEEALERDRDDVGAWSVMGRALIQLERFEEAERKLLVACAIEPLELEGAQVHDILATLYMLLGRVEDAIATWHEVEHFAANEPSIAAGLGQAYAELGRVREARDWLQVALEHDLDDDDSRTLLRMLEDEQ